MSTSRADRLGAELGRRVPKKHSASYQITTPTIPYWIPTGSVLLDTYIRGGLTPSGLPCGKFTEFFGPEASGKTSTWLRVASGVQRRGGMVVAICPEGLDEPYANRIHFVDTQDPDKWIYIEPYSLEAALSAIESAVYQFHDADFETLIVLDSLSVLRANDLTMDHQEINATEAAAAEAKLLHKFFRRGVLYYMSGSRVSCLMVRHQTQNPRPYSRSVTTHGSALDFQAWLRIRFRRTKLEFNKKQTGWFIHLACEKSKLGPDLWRLSIPLYFDGGFDPGMEAICFLLDRKVVKTDRAGYIVIGDEKRWASTWRKLYRENETVRDQIDEMVRNELK